MIPAKIVVPQLTNRLFLRSSRFIRRKSGPLHGDAFGGCNECADFGVVLLPRVAFDAAGDVDSERANLIDRGTDILWCKPAREQNRAAPGVGLNGQFPFELSAGSTNF